MMRTMLLLFFVSVLAACSSPKNTYYTLSAPAVPEVTTMTHKTRIMVGPVALPSSVDTPQLVVRNSNNQVTVYQYQRWAGPLKTEIERVVAANLARDLSTPNVWAYGQSAHAQFDYQVFIDVQSLDSKLGEVVMLDVLWTVKKAGVKAKHHAQGKGEGAKPAHEPIQHDRMVTGRSIVREAVSGDGFEPLVAAQSRALDQISTEIAKAIRVN